MQPHPHAEQRCEERHAGEQVGNIGEDCAFGDEQQSPTDHETQGTQPHEHRFDNADVYAVDGFVPHEHLPAAERPGVRQQ